MEQDLTHREALTPENATLFRALSARANYLSQDRPDCNVITKELCREFAVPTTRSYLRLKRLVKYLLGVPKLVFHYPFQQLPDAMKIFSDSDFAGCAATRRSTSGGVIMVGQHCVKTWSTTQSVVSLASAEAELHAIAKAGAQGLGVQAVAVDLGIALDIEILTDASAAIGIVRRRGLGRAKRLATTSRWLNIAGQT